LHSSSFHCPPPPPKIFDLEQYVNYSNITLKAGGPHTMNEDGTGGGVDVEKGVLIESKINPNHIGKNSRLLLWCSSSSSSTVHHSRGCY
jgi:hypothetical protein